LGETALIGKGLSPLGPFAGMTTHEDLMPLALCGSRIRV